MKRYLPILLLLVVSVCSATFINSYRFAGVESNGLATDLLSYYKYDESSGNAVDSHGSNDLTNNGAMPYNTALLNNGADCDGSAGDYLSGADTMFDFGDEDFSIGGWFKADTDTGSAMYGKSDGSTRRWETLWTGTAMRWRVNGVNADYSGAFTVNDWNLILTYHDSVNNLIGISVNGSNFDTTAHTTGTGRTGTEPEFRVGKHIFNLNGLADEMPVWGRVLSDADAVLIYNSGSPLPYSSYN